MVGASSAAENKVRVLQRLPRPFMMKVAAFHSELMEGTGLQQWLTWNDGVSTRVWQQLLAGRHYTTLRQPLTHTQIRCQPRAESINCGTEAVSLQVCDVWRGNSSEKQEKNTQLKAKGDKWLWVMTDVVSHQLMINQSQISSSSPYIKHTEHTAA